MSSVYRLKRERFSFMKSQTQGTIPVTVNIKKNRKGQRKVRKGVISLKTERFSLMKSQTQGTVQITDNR